MKNSEGYADPTATQALKNLEKAERRKQAMSYRRGDIYYIEGGYSTGSEQRAGRPAIIVSNDMNNEFSSTVEVVYLTTQPKKDLPTHVSIRSLSRESTAICEQITTVSTERIGSYAGCVTDAEMTNIEIAMMVSLDLEMGGTKTVEVVKEVVKEAEPAQPDQSMAAELAKVTAERDMLQTMYDALLSRAMGR